MQRWILIDYDGTGLHEIQARDEHPLRDSFDDEQAVALARRRAERGDRVAQNAVALHDRDAAAILELRERTYGPRKTWSKRA